MFEDASDVPRNQWLSCAVPENIPGLHEFWIIFSCGRVYRWCRPNGLPRGWYPCVRDKWTEKDRFLTGAIIPWCAIDAPVY